MAAVTVKAAGHLKGGMAKLPVIANLMAAVTVKAAGHLKEGTAKPRVIASLMAAVTAKAAGLLRKKTVKQSAEEALLTDKIVSLMPTSGKAKTIQGNTGLPAVTDSTKNRKFQDVLVNQRIKSDSISIWPMPGSVRAAKPTC